MDIVIYMREDDYYHKTDSEGSFYWSMGRVPINFKEGERIYFAVKLPGQECKVVGSVLCDEFNPDDLHGETLVWSGIDFERLSVSVPCKPFRGFRYKWW